MAKYEPRLCAPAADDRNWLHTSAGGDNACIHIKGGSVLPNCVGYAWGRWRELLDRAPKLSKGNAENWWGHTADGYERGQAPKLGAVCCWRKGQVGVGSDGAGHVAIVEEIQAGGTIVTSNSAYGGTRWYQKTLKPPYDFGKYVFQGFIYLPITYDAHRVEDAEQVCVEATGRSKGRLDSLAGTYRVNAPGGLNVRYGAGTGFDRMCCLKNGTEVKCYGYFGVSQGAKWLKIRVVLDGVQYTGFAHAGWLEKIS